MSLLKFLLLFIIINIIIPFTVIYLIVFSLIWIWKNKRWIVVEFFLKNLLTPVYFLLDRIISYIRKCIKVVENWFYYHWWYNVFPICSFISLAGLQDEISLLSNLYMYISLGFNFYLFHGFFIFMAINIIVYYFIR